MSNPKQAVAVTIHWMIPRHMPSVLQIEHDSFEHNWTEEDFLSCLRQINCIGMVAQHETRIAGFMIYELHKTRLHILNFAVAPAFRRLSVGAQMIEKLCNKLCQQRRKEIVLEIRETNLPAQQFFHSQGFRAIGILRDHYVVSGEDAYSMRYRLGESDDWDQPATVNRVFGRRKPA